MCSYCGCESITVIGRFMAEHTDIINAAGMLRRACEGGDADEVSSWVDEVSRLLHPHTRNEEVGLFRVLRRQDGFEEQVDSLCAEHSSLDEQLLRIQAGELSVATAFVDDLRHHIDREDNGLFPASAIALDGPEWDEVDETTPAPTA